LVWGSFPEKLPFGFGLKTGIATSGGFFLSVGVELEY